MEIKRIIQKLMKEVVPWKDSKVEKCLAKLRKKTMKTKINKIRDYRGIRTDTCSNKI